MMKWLALLAVKSAHRNVMRTRHTASTEMLIAHYNRCLSAHQDLYDIHPADKIRWETRWLITEMKMKISEELAKRVIMTDMANAMGLNPSPPSSASRA